MTYAPVVENVHAWARGMFTQILMTQKYFNSFACKAF